jgi:hypothetical protein
MPKPQKRTLPKSTSLLYLSLSLSPQVTPAPPPTPFADGSSPGPLPPGVLKAGLISVGSKRAEEPDPLEPEIIKRLDNKYRYFYKRKQERQ